MDSRAQPAGASLRTPEAASQAEQAEEWESTNTEAKAEVLRAFERGEQRQAMFSGVGIGYFEDENGKLIKQKNFQ